MDRSEVRVVQAALDLPAPRIEALHRTLTDEERIKAARFHQALHRDRYIAGRGQLRQQLGAYLGIPPERVRLLTGPHGKPELAPECNPDDLRFNLAHSEDRALYAFARGRHLGVDIEYMRANIEIETLAAHFFAPNEASTLLALPEAQRLTAFFACWTRKEAYLKARGDGIPFGLDKFEVSLTPDAPAALLSTAFDPADRGRWTLHALEVGPGFAAAMVIEGQDSPAISLSRLE
ncbi:MAG TPA: 4'-phosphopantetheinyl transferase superfamily protein [Chthonomonadaceae bacterium]|nr:4'-phosphopantetheinyl transferase superfamily protein [Chthonomonadaceae bacterium]